MTKIKNSNRNVQISDNKGPISFQLLMKTIASFCSTWFFFSGANGYWVLGQRSRSQDLVPLSQKSFIIISNYFLTMDLFLSATPKGWKESIVFPYAKPYSELFQKKFHLKSQIFHQLART